MARRIEARAMKGPRMRILEKLAPDKIDARLLWWIVFLVVVVSLVIPIGLPVSISEHTRKSFALVEKLPPGSIVIFSVDISSAGLPETEPSIYAILRHLMRKDAKVVMLSFTSPDGAVISEQVIGKAVRDGIIQPGKKYGVDYVNVGYIPGGETAVAAAASDWKKVVKADQRGTPMDNLPLLAGIRDSKDVAVVINIESGSTYQFYLRHWATAQRTPVVVVPGMAIYTAMLPYYTSGQFAGVVPGLRGGAEYERLVGVLGFATKSMDMLSLGHATIVIFIILGNLFEIRERLRRRSN